ncbi:MAG TPA: molybdopterin-dependent oxidoreductase [Spirochaetia bacterium]
MRKLSSILLVAGALALAAVAATPVLAEDGSPDEPVLTISRADGTASPVKLTLGALMAMPRVSFTGVDPWDGKKHEVVGTPLLGLLQGSGLLRADAQSVLLTAHNDYKAMISLDDLRSCPYLVAWEMDGKPLGTRNAVPRRGPLMSAIDFDRAPRLDREVYKYQLVWQLMRIEVR